MTQSIYEKCRLALDFILPKLLTTGWASQIDNAELLSERLGIICGSGLGHLYEALDEHYISISYADIPHFSNTAVSGHANKLVFGHVRTTTGKKLLVVLMLGRLHCYEGISPMEATFPILILRLLGVSVMLNTNASGGVNPAYRKGDIMIIRDHINFPSISGLSPLVGPLLDASLLQDICALALQSPTLSSASGCDRFLNLNNLYDRMLSQKLYQAFLTEYAEDRVHAGVYFYNFGPCYESPAEIECVKRLGGDAVGMSTLPEIAMERQLEMKIIAFALITNECTHFQGSSTHWLTPEKHVSNGHTNGESYVGPTHVEVIMESKSSASSLIQTISTFLKSFD